VVQSFSPSLLESGRRCKALRITCMLRRAQNSIYATSLARQLRRQGDRVVLRRAPRRVTNWRPSQTRGGAWRGAAWVGDRDAVCCLTGSSIISNSTDSLVCSMPFHSAYPPSLRKAYCVDFVISVRYFGLIRIRTPVKQGEFDV